MKKQICLNLCELYNNIDFNSCKFEKIINHVSDNSGYSEFRRLYIGSSFCSQYFLHSSLKTIDALYKGCKEKNIPITLTIPVFSQKDLENGKKKIDDFLNNNYSNVDELTVNDYGMLEYLKNSGYNVNLGRLLNKDYRDKRYHDYFTEPLKPKIFTDSFSQLRSLYKITGIEMDLTREMIDMSKCPKDLCVSVHFPFCYQTTGNICEIASQNLNISKKFRPNNPCSLECSKSYIKYYENNAGYYYKFGRTIYFKNTDFNITNLESARFVYFPVQMGFII